MIPVTPRVFETLLYMVEHSGTVLDREEVMEAVWQDAIVEENNLTQNISTLRRVLGEAPDSHRFIVTVPGRGYRFVADVRTPEESAELEKEAANGDGTSAVAEESPDSPPRAATQINGAAIHPQASDLAIRRSSRLTVPATVVILALTVALLLFSRSRSQTGGRLRPPRKASPFYLSRTEAVIRTTPISPKA